MVEICIKNFAQLHECLIRYKAGNTWIFRGHTHPEWRLVPKAGRNPYAAGDDVRYFTEWKRRAVEFTELSFNDDWDWLAIAQHYGLATRLLDWTYNPLAAAFFAVEHDAAADAILYAYYNTQDIVPDTAGPFDICGIGMLKPKGIIQRITRQSGVFTVHNPPGLCLSDALGPKERLEKIIIDQGYRSKLLSELSYYGMNRLTLFPDLEGLSRHVNWYMASECLQQNQNRRER